MVRNLTMYFHNNNTLHKSSKSDINILPFTQQSEPPQAPEHTTRSNETVSFSELQFPISDSPTPVLTSVQSRDAAQPHTRLSDFLVKRDRFPVQGLQSKRLPRNLKEQWVLISVSEKVTGRTLERSKPTMCQNQQLRCALIWKWCFLKSYCYVERLTEPQIYSGIFHFYHVKTSILGPKIWTRHADCSH